MRLDHKALIHILVQAFRHCSGAQDTTSCAKKVLDKLFHPFSVSAFLGDMKLVESEERSVLTELLYGLYFGEVDLEVEPKSLYLMQLMAPILSKESLAACLKVLDDEEELGQFCQTHDREGSFYIGMFPEEDVDAVWLNTHLQELVELMRQAFLELFHSQMLPNPQQEQLAWLSSFQGYSYTVDEIQKFLRLFGGARYAPIFLADVPESDTLVDKIEALLSLFRNKLPLNTLKPAFVHQMYGFMACLLSHMEALFRKPEILREGLKLFTPVIATSAKALDRQPSLISLIEGYQALLREIKGDLSQYPIVIFDQSDEPLFSENSRFIQSLQKNRQAHILHLSKSQTLKLAKKQNILPFIDTTHHNVFGFGGARNCQYLLTKQVVKREGALLMLDDDMQIPLSNLVSAAIGAYQMKDRYQSGVGFQTGRVTKQNLSYVGLDELLKAPEEVHLFAPWSDEVASSGISERLTKPGICLNLPQGCEERHFDLAAKKFIFLQTAKHLRGTGFPTGDIPTHFFMGLHDHLKRHIPYLFGVGMITCLIDPVGHFGSSVLPWNDPEVRGTFTSQKDAFAYMKSEAVRLEMQKRFRAKFSEFFQVVPVETIKFRHDIMRLLKLDVDKVINDFQKSQTLTQAEQKALVKLGELYRGFKRDVALFWEYGVKMQSENFDTALKNLQKSVENGDFPISYSFYLLSCSVGRGDFSTLLNF